MSGVQHRAVKPDDDGMRLDRWFRKYFAGLTHSRLEKLLRQGRIRLDGARAKASDRVQTGQQVRVPPEVPRDGQSPTPASGRVSQSLVEGLRASVIHRDQHLLVLNKPSGLAVQGGSKTSQHVDGVLPERPLARRKCRALSTGSTATHPAFWCWRAAAKRRSF